jgi:hypothetical protein
MNLIVLYFQGSAQTQGVMTRASAGNAMHSSGTYQLVMDPRLGLIVGTVTSPQATPGVFRKRGVSVHLFFHIPYFYFNFEKLTAPFLANWINVVISQPRKAVNES